jgi:DNA-binding transcriptional LysR family regulator
VKLEVALTDTLVDLIEVRADVAIRTGPLRASQLLARKLGESRMMLVASPTYLARVGTPRSPADLTKHNCLAFSFVRDHARGWRLHDGLGGVTNVATTGNASVSDGEGMRQLALAGLGIARLAAFHLGTDVRGGRLVSLLDAYDPRETEPVHAVFVGQAGKMAPRVRVLLDYLVANVRLE